MDIEDQHGVPSSFQILDEMALCERPVREWVTMTGWKLFGGRYDPTDEHIAATLWILDRFGPTV